MRTTHWRIPSLWSTIMTRVQRCWPSLLYIRTLSALGYDYTQYRIFFFFYRYGLASKGGNSFELGTTFPLMPLDTCNPNFRKVCTTITCHTGFCMLHNAVRSSCHNKRGGAKLGSRPSSLPSWIKMACPINHPSYGRTPFIPPVWLDPFKEGRRREGRCQVPPASTWQPSAIPATCYMLLHKPSDKFHPFSNAL